MIDATKLPVEPSKAVGGSLQVPQAQKEYARAPEAAGPQSTGNRPAATQRNTR